MVALVLLVLALGREDDDDTGADQPKPGRAEETLIADADVHGAILERGSLMTGVDASGRVRWRLRIGEADQGAAFAVCTESCPEAELSLGRDLSPVPERPDGPRLRFEPPGWRPVEARPRLRVDRPQLPGPATVRVAVPRANGRASLVVPGGRSLRIASPGELVPYLAANRRVGVLAGYPDGGQRTLLLRRRGRGWALVTSLGGAADSHCLSPDGSRVGLVGQGRPRVLDVRGGRSRAPRALPGARRAETDAGACAIGRATVTTAVLTTGSERRTSLTVHAGAQARTIALAGAFDDMWVSGRTGTTAVVVGTKLVLVDRAGRRRGTSPGVDAAFATGPDRLWVLPFRGRPYSRRF